MGERPEADILERIDQLARAVERLKRDVIRNISASDATAPSTEEKPSLFGSVQASDIPQAEIDEAKRRLFRELEDV